MMIMTEKEVIVLYLLTVREEQKKEILIMNFLE